MEIQPDRSLYEYTVINIIRRLPPEKITELIDFAKFLESEYVRKNNDPVYEDKTGTEETEKKWNKLFAEPESKNIMREMAKEAREDYYGGKTTDILITEDGRLKPA